jgi:hypothetical protein
VLSPKMSSLIPLVLEIALIEKALLRTEV